MLKRIVDRIAQARTVDAVIVATTTNREDDSVEALAEKEGWILYRGSEEDVLDRYYQAARTHGSDTIVRVTGDCPFIDPVTIDRCVQALRDGGYDFVSNCTADSSDFPRGLDVRVFTFAALATAHREARLHYQREHVAPYIWENQQGIFKIGSVITVPPGLNRQYRLTVDYPEDFELMQKLYDALYVPGAIIDVNSVVAYLDAHPEVAAINAHCEQKFFKQ